MATSGHVAKTIDGVIITGLGDVCEDHINGLGRRNCYGPKKTPETSGIDAQVYGFANQMHASTPLRCSFTDSGYGAVQSVRITDCSLDMSASGPALSGALNRRHHGGNSLIAESQTCDLCSNKSGNTCHYFHIRFSGLGSLMDFSYSANGEVKEKNGFFLFSPQLNLAAAPRGEMTRPQDIELTVKGSGIVHKVVELWILSGVPWLGDLEGCI
ncbi:hypothetical protein PAAG_05154 [Paracoccidioides lutzii Pb01]|uniref:Uncharacterized protein n=1 Tax=Paracoccidioides lutzii (strain ATCC MYA-826 / Pb01) TaxID=502779 RepID=C1H311_PARBA|nr:hypothetical protein PAAG_05154 [Paracoccidioides lutzii Pb01]EEH34105.2 hypothetical protein PAAG_05154 [Paracoccidioides lutzii Pb01]